MQSAEEQYYHRKAMASSLTARGLKNGRDYFHKGVCVYSTNIVGSMEYIVDPEDGVAKTFKSPYQAANHFVELVIIDKREWLSGRVLP